VAVVISALLFSGCASNGAKASPTNDQEAAAADSMDTGGCRPWFEDSPLWSNAPAPRHSCWNLVWEVPATLVAVPLFLGIATAPVWAPILFLK
jgi:hypothetical protein